MNASVLTRPVVARLTRLGLVALAATSLAACAKNPGDDASLFGGGYGKGGAGAGGAGYAAPGSKQDFANNVGDRIFFESDSTELSAKAQATLDRQAEWLNRYRQHSFTVEGHADERGTREYNFALGDRRAQTARDYLVAHGVSASRIRTVSFGKERPVAVCNDISCWSQNRRAVTVLGGGQS